MPLKKNKLKQRNKQLKIIQSKLMEISLKIDNYIYKSKPISLKDAQTYYEEVCSYKHQCEGNARMLQVIDKLKHQLRALIEEHCDDSYNVQEIIENSINTCPISPTYSLHDADRTDVHNYEVTAVIVDDDMNYKQKEDNIDKGEQIEYIDLYDEKDLDESIIIDKEKQDESSIIKKLEKSLSQLTVKLNNPELLQTKHHETKTANKEIISPCERSNHSEIDTSQNSADRVSHCDTKISNNTFETSNKNLMHSNNKVCRQIINNAIIVSVLEEKSSHNAPKKKRRTKKNKQDEPNTNLIKSVLKNRYNKSRKTQRKNMKTDTTCNNNKIKMTYPEQIHSNNNVINKVSKVISNTTGSMKNIYNKNVENDLSWIENIRYIREVAPDEVDVQLTYLDDNFWDTYELPTNWNDQDFL